MLPTIGRLIHVVIETNQGELVTRPGIVVRVWPNGQGGVDFLNAQVFTDGDGDPTVNDGQPNVIWQSSISYDPSGLKHRTWHWPPGAAGGPEQRAASIEPRKLVAPTPTDAPQPIFRR